MADDNKPDATAPAQSDPLQSYVDAGFLKPNYTDQDVQNLVTDLQKGGKVSYQQALGGIPPADQVDTSGIHPRADNTLDKQALQAAQLGVDSAGTSTEVTQRTKPYTQELSRFKPTEQPSTDENPAKPEAAVQVHDLGQMPREQPEQAAQSIPQGGGGAAVGAAVGQLSADYAGEGKALDKEKTAREGYASDVAGKLHEAADTERGEALASQAQAHDQYTKAQDSLQEIQHLVNDYANGHIDKNQWWSEMSVPQKIGAFIGAIGASLGGGPQAAINFVDGMVNQNIAQQQEAINRKGKAGMYSINLLNSFINAGNSYQEAMDKTRLAMMHAAMTEVDAAATTATGPIEAAKIDEAKAALQTQLDMLKMKMMAGAGGGSGQESALMIDPKTFYQDPFTGQAYKVTNPADMGNFMNVMQGYSRILDSINKGQELLDRRSQMEKTPGGMYEANKPYADTLVEGESLTATAKGAAAKLEGARGVPAGIKEIVDQLLPNFGSRFASLDKKKLEMARSMVNEFMQQALVAHGATPIQAQMGPGRGKHAGEMVPYAVLGAPQMQQERMQEKQEQAQRNKIDFKPKEQ